MGGYDWSADRLLHLTVDASDDTLTLHAGGESLTYLGPLFSLDADGALDAAWALHEGAVPFLSLDVGADRDTRLRTVTWLPGEWAPTAERVINRTDSQDNALFLRRGEVSFFVSLDFPYSTIDGAAISYPPHTVVKPGTGYECHSVSFGACRLSGERVGEFDRAEIEALSAYVERRHPPRFERPMFLSACITNRMTDVRDGRIFYSMYDNPTLYLDPALLEEDIRLCRDVGVEYYQLFEGVFDWPDREKTGKAYRRVKAVADGAGVRLGGYVDPNGPFCPHFNYEHRRLDRPTWEMRDREGRATGRMCLGNAEYAEYLTSRLVAHAREYQEELICLDFLSIGPCFAEEHGHPPGDVYRQVLHLVALMERLATTHPEYLVWSNSGNWVQWMPKLTWWNPNVYLTDPHVREYAPTLSILKLLGDGRREQMVTLHERYGIPYRAFTNCEYYAFPHSRVPDQRVFEYSFLQGLAVTPNICLGELRPFLERVPSSERDRCVTFMQRWMEFVRARFDTWKQTLRVGDAPGLGSCEVYAHVAEDAGFLCLVNQNPFPRMAHVRLEGSIGLSGPGPYCLHELYPHECPIVEQALPTAAFGDEIALHVPAHGVRIVAIGPPLEATGLEVFGLPAEVEELGTGYRVRVSAPQGSEVDLGLVLPRGELVTAVSARQTPTVPMYTFPAQAMVVERRGRLARVRVRFPRRAAPRELTCWRVVPGDVEVELPQLDTCAFLGGLVSGAFSEETEVEMDLVVAKGSAPESRLPAEAAAPRSTIPAPAAPRQTFTTHFHLPFIESSRWGNLPPYGDDTVVELAFRDPAAVGSLTATLNGSDVPVRRYHYPRKPEVWSYYIELTGAVGPGDLELSIEVEWQS